MTLVVSMSPSCRAPRLPSLVSCCVHRNTLPLVRQERGDGFASADPVTRAAASAPSPGCRLPPFQGEPIR